MFSNGKAPRAIIDFIASMLLDRIITSPSAPRMTPQTSFTLTLGLRSPPVENIANTKAALTTLVTMKRNAATMVAIVVSTEVTRGKH